VYERKKSQRGNQIGRRRVKERKALKTNHSKLDRRGRYPSFEKKKVRDEEDSKPNLPALKEWL